MKKLCFSLIFLFLFLAGVSQAIFISPAKVYIDFEPNLQKDLVFLVGDAARINVSMNGELAKYATIIKIEDFSAQGMSGQAVTIRLNLPEFIERPGRNEIDVRASEVPTGQDMIGTATAVIAPILISVPYPGIFVITSLEVPNINENETLPVTIYASNYGYDNITSASGQIEILDPSNKSLAEMKTDAKPLHSRTVKQAYATKWDSGGYKGGNYFVKAWFYYRNNVSFMTQQFKIGFLSVDVVNYTRTAKYQSISPFELIIKSLWNSKITNVYAVVKIGNATFQTPSTDLDLWEVKTLRTYFDTNGMNPGTYDATITLNYEGTFKNIAGKVEVLPAPKKKLTEQPMLLYGGAIFLVLALIVLVLLFLLLRTRRKNEP